jgi:DNA (cytosine-5)-methyltransferase 1
MKILNLYAGIGGNRKLWTPNGDEHEITAVENVKEIADIYKQFFSSINKVLL